MEVSMLAAPGSGRHSEGPVSGRPASLITSSGWYTKDHNFIPASLFGHDKAARENGLVKKSEDMPSYRALKDGHIRILDEANRNYIGLEVSPKGLPNVSHALENMAKPDDYRVIIGGVKVPSFDGTLKQAKNWAKQTLQ